MYTLNGWWFLSSGGSYPPVFMVAMAYSFVSIMVNGLSSQDWILLPFRKQKARPDPYTSPPLFAPPLMAFLLLPVYSLRSINGDTQHHRNSIKQRI